MWPADFRHGDDVWREKKSFLFFDGRASSSLTGNTSKRNNYYIHTYSLLYSITCLPYLVVTALQSNFIVRISDSKKTHNNCQHKAPRATLQQGPATQNSTQSTAETYQFILYHHGAVQPVSVPSGESVLCCNAGPRGLSHYVSGNCFSYRVSDCKVALQC